MNGAIASKFSAWEGNSFYDVYFTPLCTLSVCMPLGCLLSSVSPLAMVAS